MNVAPALAEPFHALRCAAPPQDGLEARREKRVVRVSGLVPAQREGEGERHGSAICKTRTSEPRTPGSPDTSDDDLPEHSDGWRYVPELQRQESEPVVQKRYGDSFEDTTLEAELAHVLELFDAREYGIPS